MDFLWTILVLVAVLALAWRYLGSYMAAVFDTRLHFLGFVERPLYAMLGTGPDREQTWKRYASSLLIFSGAFVAFEYLLLRIQGSLPLNPQHLGAVPPALAWNTAASFLTNTNWQNYGGETTLSYFSQIGVLTVQQFVSAAVGIAVAIALVRGFSRRSSDTIGNFWVDITRCLLYILLPVAFLAGIIMVSQGAVQTLAGPATIHDSLNHVTQTIARGPAAFMGPIMQFGTNGGGFFNVDLAHPFENPTGLTNLIYICLTLSIPFALTYTFGKMVGSVRHGAALLAAMVIIFGVWVGFTSYAEHQANPAVAVAGVAHQPAGNMEGKEVRFGDTTSALFNVSMTQTSDGAVDSSNDSFNPIGGFGPLSGMMLGEVTPGGVGSGLYTLLLFAIVAVFIGGLMIGRTPEYLGKKIQAREVKLAGFGILVMPVVVLVLTGIAVSIHAGRAGPLNGGPHGFTEILYAFTSQTNNNGSAMAGLTGNHAFYNVVGTIGMLLGRFAIIVPSLALGGALAAKNIVPASAGTFRTDNTMFVGLLIGVIVIVGGLTFFPAVALGPIAEELSHTFYSVVSVFPSIGQSFAHLASPASWRTLLP
jgi:K+-transporting ATPase ATPase A chain